MSNNSKTYGKKQRIVVGGICKDQYFGAHRFRLGQKNPISRWSWVPGGGAANASLSHSRLAPEKDIILMATVGDDVDGYDLKQYMKKHGIMMPVKLALGVNTSLSNIYVDDVSKESTICSVAGARVVPIPLDQIEQCMPMAEALCLVAPFANKQITPILDIASRHNVPVFFGLGSMQINLGYRRLANLLTQPVEMVICNNYEAQCLTGMSDIFQQLQALQFGGSVKVAIITDGSDGIHALSGSEFLDVKAYHDGRPVLDDTGAGDGATAAIVDAILRGEDWEMALRVGARLGFEVCTANGATTALLNAQEIQAYIESLKTMAAA